MRGVRLDEACTVMLLRICYNRLRQAWVPGGYPPNRPATAATAGGTLPGSKRSNERLRLVEVRWRRRHWLRAGGRFPLQWACVAEYLHTRATCPPYVHVRSRRSSCSAVALALPWPRRCRPVAAAAAASLPPPQALTPRGQQEAEPREQGEVAWLSQAFGVYREAVAAGVKPSMRMLNRILMCLRVAWEGKQVRAHAAVGWAGGEVCACVGWVGGGEGEQARMQWGMARGVTGASGEQHWWWCRAPACFLERQHSAVSPGGAPSHHHNPAPHPAPSRHAVQAAPEGADVTGEALMPHHSPFTHPGVAQLAGVPRQEKIGVEAVYHVQAVSILEEAILRWVGGRGGGRLGQGQGCHRRPNKGTPLCSGTATWTTITGSPPPAAPLTPPAAATWSRPSSWTLTSRWTCAACRPLWPRCTS